MEKEVSTINTGWLKWTEVTRVAWDKVMALTLKGHNKAAVIRPVILYGCK